MLHLDDKDFLLIADKNRAAAVGGHDASNFNRQYVTLHASNVFGLNKKNKQRRFPTFSFQIGRSGRLWGINNPWISGPKYSPPRPCQFGGKDCGRKAGPWLSPMDVLTCCMWGM